MITWPLFGPVDPADRAQSLPAADIENPHLDGELQRAAEWSRPLAIARRS